LILLSEQNRELELIEIIKDSIDIENDRIEMKLKFEDFQRLIDRGVPTKDILAEVKSRADSIYKAEHPEPKEPIAESIAEPIKEPIIEPVKEDMNQTTYYATYRITGTEKELMAVSNFLRTSGTKYKVTDQGEI